VLPTIRSLREGTLVKQMSPLQTGELIVIRRGSGVSASTLAARGFNRMARDSCSAHHPCGSSNGVRGSDVPRGMLEFDRALVHQRLNLGVVAQEIPREIARISALVIKGKSPQCVYCGTGRLRERPQVNGLVERYLPGEAGKVVRQPLGLSGFGDQFFVANIVMRSAERYRPLECSTKLGFAKRRSPKRIEPGFGQEQTGLGTAAVIGGGQRIDELDVGGAKRLEGGVSNLGS